MDLVSVFVSKKCSLKVLSRLCMFTKGFLEVFKERLVKQFDEPTCFGGPFPANVFIANQESSEKVTLLAGMMLISCNI